MMKKPLLLLTAIFLSLNFTSYAQEETKSVFWQKVRFGGGLGISFGNGFTSIGVSPNAIYQVNNEIGLGVGLNFLYNSRKNVHKSTVIGGSTIALYNPFQGIQTSAEFEMLNVNRDFDENFVTNADDNYWYPALFLGAGYRTGNVIFGIRYDVLYDEDKSIYAEPWMPFVRIMF